MAEVFLQGLSSPPLGGLSLPMPTGTPWLPAITVAALFPVESPPDLHAFPFACSRKDLRPALRLLPLAACSHKDGDGDRDGDGDALRWRRRAFPFTCSPRDEEVRCRASPFAHPRMGRDGACRALPFATCLWEDGDGDGLCRGFPAAHPRKDGDGHHRAFSVTRSWEDGDRHRRALSVAYLRKDGDGRWQAFSIACLRKDGDGGRRPSVSAFSWKNGDGRCRAFSVACLRKDRDGGFRASAMAFSQKNGDRGCRAFSTTRLWKARDGRCRSFSITCLRKDGDGGHRASAMEFLRKNVDGNRQHQAFTMANSQRNEDGRCRTSSIACTGKNGDGGLGGSGNGYPNHHPEEANEGRDDYPIYCSEEVGGGGNEDALLFPLPRRQHRGLFRHVVGFIEWVDAQKEQALPQRQRRGFYTHDDWLQHRSSTRHIRHMLSSLSSRVILALIPPVFTVTAISTVLAAYNSSVAGGLLPSFMPLFHANPLPYELTAPALALLLVFRTDAAYSRYDEGRKTWTKVIGSVKNFARQSTQMIQDPHDLALKSSLLSYIVSFPLSLKCHLIHGLDAKEDLSAYLDEDDLALVLSSQHRPNCLLQLMAQSLSQSHLKDSERILMEENILQFNMSISVCERLIRTPIPLSYTRLTSRFLVLWHLTLPIALWDSCHWLVVPATFFSAATLFCIEEVGVLIEEPFSMMALGKICGIVSKNIAEIVEFHEKAREHLIQKREKIKARTPNGALTSRSRDSP